MNVSTCLKRDVKNKKHSFREDLHPLAISFPSRSVCIAWCSLPSPKTPYILSHFLFPASQTTSELPLSAGLIHISFTKSAPLTWTKVPRFE